MMARLIRQSLNYIPFDLLVFIFVLPEIGIPIIMGNENFDEFIESIGLKLELFDAKIPSNFEKSTKLVLIRGIGHWCVGTAEKNCRLTPSMAALFRQQYKNLKFKI